MVVFHSYHLVMTNIAMENPRTKWRFLAGKIIYFYGPFSMAMLNNQRVDESWTPNHGDLFIFFGEGQGFGASWTGVFLWQNEARGEARLGTRDGSMNQERRCRITLYQWKKSGLYLHRSTPNKKDSPQRNRLIKSDVRREKSGFSEKPSEPQGPKRFLERYSPWRR